MACVPVRLLTTLSIALPAPSAGTTGEVCTGMEFEVVERRNWAPQERAREKPLQMLAKTHRRLQ